MATYLATIALIFVLLLAAIAVERIYRAFAAKHPQLGPFRSPDGCGCCASKRDCGDGGGCNS